MKITKSNEYIFALSGGLAVVPTLIISDKLGYKYLSVEGFIIYAISLTIFMSIFVLLKNWLKRER
jgi:hypothetical protein